SADFDGKAENEVTSYESVETGTISGVDSVTIGGLEAAAVYGPFSVQGEYYHTQIERETLADADLGGWYAQASWFATGEYRPYKPSEGLFGRVNPKHPLSLSKGGVGALELAARHSNIDLNDGLVQGGEMNNVTLGANWYLNDYSRLMA